MPERDAASWACSACRDSLLPSLAAAARSWGDRLLPIIGNAKKRALLNVDGVTSPFGRQREAEPKRLRELETDNAKLKRMYADLALENSAIKEALNRQL